MENGHLTDTFPIEELFAADFRDRVVHHFLYNRISPFFEKKFIYDSYSCRKGKGTLFGIKRLQHHIRSCSQNYARDCYVLKLDLTGYFMNIDRKILYGVIESCLPHDFPQRDFILWLTHEVVMYEPIMSHFSSLRLIKRSLIRASVPYMYGYFSYKSSCYRYNLY